MDIQSIQYVTLDKGTVFINGDITTSYPTESVNIQEWISLGNTIENCNIEILRCSKLGELDNTKTLDQTANFSYTNSNGTYELRNSEKSKNKIVGRNQVWREGVTSKVWISASGEPIQFTKEDYDNIIDLIESKEEVVYTKEAVIGVQIRSITDYAELESFDVQASWDNI
jgi:hypothetical protein